MVEIKRTIVGDGGVKEKGKEKGSSELEEDRYRLIYSKSKVYVNPTAFSRDNIPGFVALVKRVECFEVWGM